jgi:hypothetical protein
MISVSQPIVNRPMVISKRPLTRVSDRATLPSERTIVKDQRSSLQAVWLNCYFPRQTERGGGAPATTRLSASAPSANPNPKWERRELAEAEKQLEPTLPRRLQLAHSRCTDMKDHTTNPYVRKTLSDLLVRALSAIGSKIFREDDRRACDHGWQITPRHGGISRSYRDPRFDGLTTCEACNGRGCSPYGVTCSDCHGTGRIVLGPAVVSQAERGQP